MRYSLQVLLLILVLSIQVFGEAIDSNSVSIDTEQPGLLIDLMHYIKETHGSYSINELNTDSIKDRIESNKNNPYLNEKIVKLLSHRVYDYFAEIMQAQVNDSVIKGKDAYRLAFTSLPWKQIDMSAGLISRLVDFFSSRKEDLVLSFLNQINENKRSYQDTVFMLVRNVLPVNCSKCRTVNIYFVLDGNRGSFAEGSDIIMELTELTKENIHNVIFTSAHELHHICYGNWLDENFSDSSLNANEKVLLEWQYRLIYEGSAQLINYRNYPDRVKDLYDSRELIMELFDFWIKSVNELLNSQNPENDYSKLKKYIYNDLSGQLLKKYSGEKYKELFPYRPSVDYYISYHLYNSIYENQGMAELDHVLQFPQDLLQKYNDSRTDKDVVPKIPDEIVKIWQQNLYKAKKNY